MLQHHNNLNNQIREGEENLSRNNKHLLFNSLYSCYFNQFKSAFSLVELSIVLIIIGLLIGAVISGKALIDQAKIITIRNEFEEIKNAVSLYIHDRGIPTDENIMYNFPEELAKYGYIEKSKLFTTDTGGSTLGSIKSKIKGRTNAYNLWANLYLTPDVLEFYYAYLDDTVKNFSDSTLFTHGFTLTAKFCKKLVTKLRNYYGVNKDMKIGIPETIGKDKYTFTCYCLDDENCENDDSITTFYGYILLKNL